MKNNINIFYFFKLNLHQPSPNCSQKKPPRAEAGIINIWSL